MIIACQGRPRSAFAVWSGLPLSVKGKGEATMAEVRQICPPGSTRAQGPPPSTTRPARPEPSRRAHPSLKAQTCALAWRPHHSKHCHAPRSPDAHALRPPVSVPQHRDKRTKTGFVHNPMDEALLRKCDTMMKGIMKRTQAVHFSKPVDWKKMGLHEYPRIVKQPMDLGTVQERLARHHYTRLEELALDCLLVWVSKRTHTPINTPSAPMSPRPRTVGGEHM